MLKMEGKSYGESYEHAGWYLNSKAVQRDCDAMTKFSKMPWILDEGYVSGDVCRKMKSLGKPDSTFWVRHARNVKRLNKTSEISQGFLGRSLEEAVDNST